MICQGVASQSVSLAWDPNSETNLAGYVIYYGTASGQYSSSNNVGNTTNTTVSGLMEGGNYYFVVTAYDASGLESDPSNEVNYQVPSAGPTISGLYNQSTPKNTPKVVLFTVSRGTNTNGILSVTALSSDTFLLPRTNIVITGVSSNYTATLTPSFNAFGLTTVTIIASNGLQTSSSSFSLYVVYTTNALPTSPKQFRFK